MTISERIKRFLNEAGLKISDLSREIGVSHQTISYSLRENGNPSCEFIARLTEKYKNLNTRWLLNGEGAMFIDRAPEHETCPSYNNQRIKDLEEKVELLKSVIDDKNEIIKFLQFQIKVLTEKTPSNGKIQTNI